MVSNLPNYLFFSDAISSDLSDTISEINPDVMAILVDENTRKNCLPLIDVKNLNIIEIKSGEREKTLSTCEYIWNELTKMGCSRKSLLINLGGGVIGDMGGFCAATYKRGISFVNLPTTLLSQVDASIGGKLGVDFYGLKNHIGLFKEPKKVIIHSRFLETLSKRELKSGFAEIVKHSLIYDADQWNYLLNTSFNDLNWNDLIPKSVGIKHKIVHQDPHEKGLRKILNFGHTLGHAIETYFLESDSPILHGEAVALGMILESHISLQKGMIDESTFNQIEKFIKISFELPVKIPSHENIEKFLLQDKKNEMGELKLSIISKIGVCQYDVLVSEAELKKCLLDYSVR